MTWGGSDIGVQVPDVERDIVDTLNAFSELDYATKGIGLPTDWTPKSAPHLKVAQDGEFLDHPVRARCTIRVVAFGEKPTETKRLAHLAQGCLLLEPHISSLTGVLPTRDDETDAELAWFTVRVDVRTITLASS